MTRTLCLLGCLTLMTAAAFGADDDEGLDEPIIVETLPDGKQVVVPPNAAVLPDGTVVFGDLHTGCAKEMEQIRKLLEALPPQRPILWD